MRATSATDAGGARQLVDDLDPDQRRVHVQHDQPLGATEQALALQGDVEPGRRRHRQQRALQRLAVALRRQQRVNLDRGQRVLGQAADLLDVRPLRRQRRRQRVQVGRAQRGADGRDDVAPALAACRRLRLVAAHGLEVQLHLELLGGEQQLLEDVARLGDADQQAQRQLPLDDDLLDVVQGCPLLRQDAGQGCGDPGAIGAGDCDKNAVGSQGGGSVAGCRAIY